MSQTFEDVAPSDDEWFRQQKREWLIADVNTELRLFKNEGNGLNLWTAYALVRNAGEPIPEVVLCYFDEIGQRLAGANNITAVAKAVGMAGHSNAGSALKHWNQVQRKLAIVSDVRRLMFLYQKPKLSWRKACGLVADRYGMKPGTVMAVWKSWKKQRPANLRESPTRRITSVFDVGA